jgi:TPR repeat protein
MKTAYLSISQPEITQSFGKTRLCCYVNEFENNEKSKITNSDNYVWIEVDEQYGKYLVSEVCDSFIVAVLPYAYFNNLNIHVKTMSRELYHNIVYQLLPALSKYNPSIHRIEIRADKLVDLIFGGEQVGTGLSMGVDSFDVINTYYENINSKLKDFKISSLVINNVGAYSTSESIPKEVIKSSQKIGNELGLPILYINSNIHLWRKMNFITVHSYYNAFSILALGKYWKKYYYATGYDISEFDITRAGYGEDSTRYELLLFKCFSYNSLTFYSPSLEKNRYDKTKSIAESKIAQKYLDSCLYSAKCGKCDKCVRNIINLDACSKLDLFEQTINLDFWKNNREDFILELIHERDNPLLKNAYKGYCVENKYDFSEVKKKYTEIELKYSEYPDAFYAYMSIEKGSPRFIKKLIGLYGKENKYDIDKAIDFFKNKTASKDHPRRDVIFGDLLYRRGKLEDLEEIKGLVTITAKEGDAGAMYRLGRMYRDGKGVEKDLDKAIEWMRKASEKKYGWSENELIDLLLTSGTPKDFIEIREITKTLIENANPSVKSGVMGRLGRMYRDGKGVEKDLDKAIEWMRKAAKRNTVWESELINMLWKRGTPDDLAELKSVVENGAAEGKAYAFLWIGRMYRDGKGVEKDLDQAIEWMRRAAEEKYGWSRNELVDMLSKRGTPEDIAEMKDVAEKAAGEGDIGAMGRLGRMYRDGKGVKKDLDRAIEWIRKAAEKNPIWNIELRELRTHDITHDIKTTEVIK